MPWSSLQYALLYDSRISYCMLQSAAHLEERLSGLRSAVLRGLLARRADPRPTDREAEDVEGGLNISRALAMV